MSGSSRITNRHLERSAAVYVRQSTQNQVLRNRESRQRQYGLAERARELGWPDERILIIDSDLGESAASQGTRSGFGQLCEQVSRGRVGAIFGIEVSRLARNTVEWFQLLDLCRVNDTVLVEDSQVYAPGREDDGLILGIKGTFSATELSVLRARMEGGRRSKAQRGELYSSPPVGFVREGNGLRKDPDLRVQAALEAVFAHFGEGGSGLQATHLLREAGVQLPSRPHGADGLTWREAAYTRVMDILKNPAMGGAYAYGKSRHAYRDDGTLLAPEERWRVLKPGRHDGYVSWPQWLEVQQTLAANSTVRERNRGAAREGAALLQGLAVCGHCGRSLLVRYNKGRSYYCNQRTPDLGQRRSCFSVGGIEIDRVVARRFLDLVSPSGVEAARAAAQAVAERAETAFRSQRLELEQCRYEAGLAERRYRQVDPDNRLIAATLEREWEAALRAVESAQFALEAARERRPDPPPPSFFAGLGSSLERVWDAPGPPTATASASLPAWSRRSPSRWTGKATLKWSFTGGAAARTPSRSSASRAGRCAGATTSTRSSWFAGWHGSIPTARSPGFSTARGGARRRGWRFRPRWCRSCAIATVCQDTGRRRQTKRKASL